jgi:hypothetical protein
MFTRSSRPRALARTAIVIGALCAAIAGQAQAATTVGETFVPTALACGAGSVTLQTESPDGQYAMPSAGVITAWSFQATATPPSLKLKVARSSGVDSFTIVGESAVKNPTPNELNTYTDVRIAVQAGDVIGHYLATNGDCARNTGEEYGFHVRAGDAAPGTALAYQDITQVMSGYAFNLSARLEADVDNDGFGDETQDACPTDATKQGDCDPPETTITKDAPKRLAGDKLKFRFASDEAGSTFECKLKGTGLKPGIKQFNDCVSPRKYKNLDPGRYRFKVRAIDAASNLDATPAKDRFRVID